MAKARLNRNQRYYIRGFIERAEREYLESQAFVSQVLPLYEEAWLEIEQIIQENYLNLVGEYDRVSSINGKQLSESQLRQLAIYQQVQSQVIVIVSQLLDEQSSLVEPYLREKAHQGFLSRVYDYKVEMGTVEQPYVFNENVVELILQRQWFGGNYYSRSIANNELLRNTIDDILAYGVVRGFPLEYLTQMLLKRYEWIGAGRAKTLIYSEVGFVLEQANFFSMQDVGLERYVYLATLEINTCEICRDLDMTTHLLKEAEVGKNYPLMHGNCRCNAVGYYEGEPPRMRWMRDPETGKGRLIRAIPYDQWFKQYVVTA